MEWFINWLNSFKKWVIVVSIDGGEFEEFDAYFSEKEAHRIFEMVRYSKPVDEDSPVRKYQLMSRQDWNQQAS
ncbi:MAG: hypothetical protein OEX81_03005 [Candidatus Pacebacteria bacterium]|nr:hypothetical protein [Candidatus Paceibacterota bacterium]